MLSRNTFVREKMGAFAPRPYSLKSPLAIVLALCVLTIAPVSVMAEEPQIDWKTLPEYMAMDRDEQRQLISHTRRLVMRKLAETDIDRAECVSWLFNFDTEEGRSQFYDTKGLLKAAAEKGLDWKAQQIVAHTITKDFCPAKSEVLSQSDK